MKLIVDDLGETARILSNEHDLHDPSDAGQIETIEHAARRYQDHTCDSATGASGGIAGIVYDRLTYRPIENASVALKNASSTTTDEEGEFSIVDMEPGVYRITVSHAGYVEQTYRIIVAAGETIELDPVHLIPFCLSSTKPNNTWVEETETEPETPAQDDSTSRPAAFVQEPVSSLEEEGSFLAKMGLGQNEPTPGEPWNETIIAETQADEIGCQAISAESICENIDPGTVEEPQADICSEPDNLEIMAREEPLYDTSSVFAEAAITAEHYSLNDQISVEIFSSPTTNAPQEEVEVPTVTVHADPVTTDAAEPIKDQETAPWDFPEASTAEPDEPEAAICGQDWGLWQGQAPALGPADSQVTIRAQDEEEVRSEEAFWQASVEEMGAYPPQEAVTEESSATDSREEPACMTTESLTEEQGIFDVALEESSVACPANETLPQGEAIAGKSDETESMSEMFCLSDHEMQAIALGSEALEVSGLTGFVRAQPNPVYLGLPVTLAYTLTNVSCDDPDDLLLQIVVANPDKSTAQELFEIPTDCPRGRSSIGGFIISTIPYEARLYRINMQVVSKKTRTSKLLLSTHLETKAF